MKNPSLPLLILLLTILLLAIAFLALDFKAARSSTRADSQVNTIRSGEGYNERPPLVIYVQAPGNLAGPLQQALFNRVGTAAPFSTIRITETPASEPGSAALVVIVDRRTYIWTPVYATADLGVQVAFASDGQVEWVDLGEIDTVMQTSPAVRLSGEFDFADNTVGLVSHPGYRSHIAGQISDRITETLTTALTGVTP
jgi:hypothetical protein